jgi:hypothetical protein
MNQSRFALSILTLLLLVAGCNFNSTSRDRCLECQIQLKSNEPDGVPDAVWEAWAKEYQGLPPIHWTVSTIPEMDSTWYSLSLTRYGIGRKLVVNDDGTLLDKALYEYIPPANLPDLVQVSFQDRNYNRKIKSVRRVLRMDSVYYEILLNQEDSSKYSNWLLLKCTKDGSRFTERALSNSKYMGLDYDFREGMTP